MLDKSIKTCYNVITMKDTADKLDVTNRKYQTSDKGKQTLSKYQRSEKGKKVRNTYLNSEKGLEAQLRYYLSEKGVKTRQYRNELRKLMTRYANYIENHPKGNLQDFLSEDTIA